jgi:hypothetical protein
MTVPRTEMDKLQKVLDARCLAIGLMMGEFGSFDTLLSRALLDMGVDMANGELVVNRTVDYGRVRINGVPVEVQIKLTTQTDDMVNPGGAMTANVVFPPTNKGVR